MFGSQPQVVRPLALFSSLALGAALATACGDGPSEPENQAPVAVGSMPDIETFIGESVSTDVVEYFSDPDEDTLRFAVTSSPQSVATAGISGSTITARAWPRVRRP